MEKCLVFLIVIFLAACQHKASTISSQIIKPIEDTIYTSVEKEAQPKKGFDDFFKYLGELKYPKLANEQSLSNYTDWTARWVVEKDGSLTHISIIRGGSKELEDQLIKILKLYPKWNPAMRNRKNVRSEFLLPMKVNLGNN